MDDAREDDPSTVCCFHPREVVVGVCAICLKERLLVLAARQGRRQARHESVFRAPSKKPSIAIPTVFAFGSSLLHRFDYSRHVQDSAWDGDSDSDDSTDSLDDSFISIKFEDDGQLSWEKKGPHPGTSSSAAAQCSNSSPQAAGAGGQSLVEHPKRRRGSIRWRKQFGHLLRLPRWKRTSKASICNVGSTGKTAEGASGRRTRSLARARTTE